MLFDINHSKIFYDPPPRIMKIKTKINQWDFKLKNFSKAKKTLTETKRQLSEWEKIFANDNGLIFKIYKQYLKKKQPNQKMGRRSKQPFLQKIHIDGQEAHRKVSASLIIRETQIETAIRYHLTPVRMVFKKSAYNKCWTGYVEREPPYTQYSYYGEECGSSLKN